MTSPFPFPTDGQPMFPTVDENAHQARLDQARDIYDNTVQRINEEWQMALDRQDAAVAQQQLVGEFAGTDTASLTDQEFTQLRRRLRAGH